MGRRILLVDDEPYILRILSFKLRREGYTIFEARSAEDAEQLLGEPRGDADAVGGVLGGEATFLDVGLRLGAFGGIGYYYVLFDRKTVFEIPTEYPDSIAGVPPEGEGRYTGGSIGFEAGLSLTYPIAPWFMIGSRLTYRSARIAELTDAGANVLDLDGDETGESISLSGLMVQLTVSINIDLSLDGRKE